VNLTVLILIRAQWPKQLLSAASPIIVAVTIATKSPIANLAGAMK
jgi:hypothetical protein